MAASLAKGVERKQQANDHSEPDEVPKEALQTASGRDGNVFPELLAVLLGARRFGHGIPPG